MKANKTMKGRQYQTTGEEKTRNERVTVFQLLTINP
jgi:hypothetical protein